MKIRSCFFYALVMGVIAMGIMAGSVFAQSAAPVPLQCISQYQSILDGSSVYGVFSHPQQAFCQASFAEPLVGGQLRLQLHGRQYVQALTHDYVIQLIFEDAEGRVIEQTPLVAFSAKPSLPVWFSGLEGVVGAYGLQVLEMPIPAGTAHIRFLSPVTDKQFLPGFGGLYQPFADFTAMTLRIHSAEFITSAPSIKEAPVWDLPEIAMVGRSNVGKSSLINTLCGRKNLAKTSNTPGKTRLINFYNINEAFSLVDLPGYGYAKVSKSMQQAWQRNLEAYLKQRKNIALVIQLIDSRHPHQESDKLMLDWLNHQQLATIVVLTKMDKLSRNDFAKQIRQVAKALELQEDQVFPFSATSGYGKDQLLSFIKEYLQSR